MLRNAKRLRGCGETPVVHAPVSLWSLEILAALGMTGIAAGLTDPFFRIRSE